MSAMSQLGSKDRARLRALQRQVEDVTLVAAPDGRGVIVRVWTHPTGYVTRMFTGRTTGRALATALRIIRRDGLPA